MKIRIIAVLLLCLLLVGCANVAESKPLGTFTPNTTGDHDHDHEQERPQGGNNNRPPVATTKPTEAPLGPARFQMYVPNENGDGFKTNTVNMSELHHDGIIVLLQVKGVVNEDVAVNSCKKEGTQLHLDFNQAFLEQLMTKDANGEKMLIGSIVNTFLSAYQCESVLLTVDGASFTSSTATYNAPISFVQ